MTILRDIGAAVLWLVVALVVAIGAAGIVTGVGGPPGSSARPELTSAGDRELLAGIADSSDRIRDLADEVSALGTKGREALAALNGRDVDLAQRMVDEGSTIASRIATLAGDLSTVVAALPGSGTLAPLSYGPGPRAQRALVASAASSTSGIESTWLRFSAAAVAAERMATLLTLHDEQTAAAAKHGRAGRYAEALAALDKSDATVAEIDRLHAELSLAADTSVLAAWIDRHKNYDTALRTLYGDLVASKGRVTAAVRSAIDAEAAARALLPPDTRALTVVMSEVARGGLQQTLIAIEQSSGRIDDIMAQLDAETAAPTR
jgi:hypothetical protein